MGTHGRSYDININSAFISDCWFQILYELEKWGRRLWLKRREEEKEKGKGNELSYGTTAVQDKI